MNRTNRERATIALTVASLIGMGCAVVAMLTACAAPPMGVADPVTNGNLAAQTACTTLDAGAGATVSATKTAIDKCRCEAKAAHGEPCDAGGAP